MSARCLSVPGGYFNIRFTAATVQCENLHETREIFHEKFNHRSGLVKYLQAQRKHNSFDPLSKWCSLFLFFDFIRVVHFEFLLHALKFNQEIKAVTRQLTVYSPWPIQPYQFASFLLKIKWLLSPSSLLSKPGFLWFLLIPKTV